MEKERTHFSTHTSIKNRRVTSIHVPRFLEIVRFTLGKNPNLTGSIFQCLYVIYKKGNLKNTCLLTKELRLITFGTLVQTLQITNCREKSRCAFYPRKQVGQDGHTYQSQTEKDLTTKVAGHFFQHPPTTTSLFLWGSMARQCNHGNHPICQVQSSHEKHRKVVIEKLFHT